MRVDEALLPQPTYNIETDEPRGKTRCKATGCLCLTWRPEDADKLAQEVVNVWGSFASVGHAPDLNADFKVLFDKVEAYRFAKRTADNRREHNMMTTDVEEHERVTRTEFLEARRALNLARRKAAS
jgi:hypothetical protein